MITATLGDLRKADPCSESWIAFLKRTGIDNFTASDDLIVPFPITKDLGEIIWCMKVYKGYESVWYEYAYFIADTVKDYAPEAIEKTKLKYGWLAAFKTQNFAEIETERKEREDAKAENRDENIVSARETFRDMCHEKLVKMCKDYK